jgi:glycosyltransferase involved in cell wall biosynthesis
VICFSHVNWDHIWQRNHHLVSRLAERSKVMYINTSRLDAFAKHTPIKKLRFRRERENLWRYEMFIFPYETLSPLVKRLNAFILETRVLYRMKRLGFGSPILWFFFPTHNYMIGRFNERAVVYDIQDEYSHFLWAPRDTAEREKNLLEAADVTFTGTDALFEQKSPLARGTTRFFGCGVDFDHFSRLYHRDPPRELRHLKNDIVLGYFGAIDERIDRELLLHLVRAHPDWDLVMIGPVLEGIFEPFEAPNVAWTGSKDYSLLPRFLSRFDVCLMPFAINELTRHINPTKALEYFASGRPVVSTPIPDMVKYYGDVIYFASTPDEFVAQCEEALRDFPPERRERGIELARERSWETVVAEMRKMIDGAIAWRRSQAPK